MKISRKIMHIIGWSILGFLGTILIGIFVALAYFDPIMRHDIIGLGGAAITICLIILASICFEA